MSLQSHTDFLQNNLAKVLAHNYYQSAVSQHANIPNHFVQISDSKLIVLVSLLKYLETQKKIPLNFIIQDKYISIFLAFSISELLYASFSFKSS